VSTYLVEESRTVRAPAALVYGVIADYRDGHPHIVPRQFSNLVVEQGGYGAGTVFTFQAHAFGATRTVRAMVREPEPGRVLEEVMGGGGATRFTVDPVEDGRASHVTISTHMPRSSGLRGMVETMLSGWFLRRVFREELARLDAFASQKAADEARPGSGG
jgi:hypothetical protein